MAFTADKVRQGVQQAAAGGYSIDNSLRFNDDDSAYLNWTPSSAGNKKTFTYSFWVKRGNLFSSSQIHIFGVGDGAGSVAVIQFENDTFRADFDGDIKGLQTTQVFRDPSAWYHFIVATDSTQSTTSDRVKIYCNGTQITDFSTANYPTLNEDSNRFNNTVTNNIGKHPGAGSASFDGYLAEVNFVDGYPTGVTQANWAATNIAESFGETGTYGEWKPIEVTGMTYGTNGFYLDFSNSGSLGTDASSNTNNWTVNNLAATDQMLDSPTNNFCTLNPITGLASRATFSEGNLKCMASSTADSATRGTIGMTSGKWYCEAYVIRPTSAGIGIGIADGEYIGGDVGSGQAISIVLSGTTSIYMMNNTTQTQSSLGSYTTGDVIGLRIDMDAKTLKFYRNNSQVGTVETFTGDTARVTTGSTRTTNGWVLNFGQDSSFAGNKTAQGNQDSGGVGDFYYTPPTGFLALCTSNLPDPAVIPSEHFNTVLYTGTENASVHGAVTGVGFQPDMLWFKNRNFSYNHSISDVVRGNNKFLQVNSTSSEVSLGSGLDLTSFDSDGFSLGTSSWGLVCGKEGSTFRTYVTWCWKAGGTGVSNTNGSITSTVSANSDAGFSIVSYTGSGSAANVGHGLSVAPEFVVVKKRNSAGTSWVVLSMHAAASSPEDYYGKLEQSDSFTDHATIEFWGNTAPTATVFYLGDHTWNNASTDTYIAYCFHSVDGYSKVGSYTGNGSSDGTFVYTSFAPKYVMIKQSSASGEMWNVFDDARSPYNLVNDYIKANESGAENVNHTTLNLDFTSNGFKVRGTNTGINTSGATYIFLAFAETPFSVGGNAR